MGRRLGKNSPAANDAQNRLKNPPLRPHWQNPHSRPVKGALHRPVANRPLADALAAARRQLTQENVERAFERATSTDQADFKTGSFEVYGAGGVGLLVDVWTDNANRAAADIRQAVGKAGMKVASVGSVAFNFDRKGVVEVGATGGGGRRGGAPGGD
eukprot:TRINITY_DN4797_c0_g1_i1.p3 TRINITY_DN4797_c0_g1~~TRINITY_DN4797_c0_g1_i1.p3  ORF type:complete len:157 (-),score=44.73 TRINITY_DN4797_c0_g1_i1:487-957(-)